MRTRTPLAAIALALLVLSTSVHALECDEDALCPSDPCIITGVHRLTEDCSLDFSAKDVTIAQNGVLIWPPDSSEVDVFARNLTLRGRLSSVGPGIGIEVEQNFVMEPPGKILVRGKRDFYGGYTFQETASVNIEAGGDVSLAGSVIKLQGSIVFFTVDAATVSTNMPISVKACSEDVAAIDLNATAGSIVTRKRLNAKSCGPEAVGVINMTATGSISVEGPVRTSAGTLAGDNFGISLEADGDVFLKKATLFGPFSGGGVTIESGGNVAIGSIRSRGRGRPGYYSYGLGGNVTIDAGATGTLTIKKIDTSCSGHPCEAGEIALGAGCYTDLTGANLRALPDGAINIGCGCMHTGTDCDGGCVIDKTKFTPELSPNLPPCP